MTIAEDSTQTNAAAGDYLIPFRLKGKNPEPVKHDRGLLTYAGEREIPPELLQYKAWKGHHTENRYSHWIWRQYASCFWDDIRMSHFVDNDGSTEEDDEMHLHPLQLDVIDRACELWSNPGDSVFTPFMGVGSEVYGAISNGRRGVGVELKTSYYHQAVKNCKTAVNRRNEEKPASLFQPGT
jgi:hypothetical protein